MSNINPYESVNAGPPSGYSAAAGTVQVLAPLVEKAGWMKFIGILCIIGGALYCITIIGAIWGIPFILAGLNLTQASTSYRQGYPNNPAMLLEGSQKLGTSIMIVGIIFAIGVVLSIIYMAFVLLMVIASIGAAATSQGM